MKTKSRMCELSEKMCPKCKTMKPISDFYVETNFENGHCYACKDCEKERNRARMAKKYEADPKKYSQRSLESYKRHRETRIPLHWAYEQRVKDAVFEAYGGYVCACCGETIKQFLTIDHVNGGGTKHRKETKGGGHFTYMWIKRNNYPAGLFQVLCFNCNSGRALNGGICPHKEAKK